jgi:hypothetical protein
MGYRRTGECRGFVGAASGCTLAKQAILRCFVNFRNLTGVTSQITLIIEF